MKNFGWSSKSVRQSSIKPASMVIIVLGVDEVIEGGKGVKVQNLREHHQLRDGQRQTNQPPRPTS